MNTTTGLGPTNYTEAEIAQLRMQLKKHSEKARAEARKQGVKLHPKIVTRRKAT